MKNLEFFRNISIGQYVDTGSRLHGWNPGTKYLLLAALALPALAAPTPFGVLVPLAAALVLGGAARVGPSFILRGLKPAFPVFLLTAAMQFVFSWPGDASAVIFALGPLSATVREAWIAAMVAARTTSMLAVVSFFTAITTESEAARGMEESLRPLERLGLPVHRLSLAVAVSIRFIPIVAGELEEIAKAQASRGASFGTGRGGPIARARAYLPLFVPVTVRALERAEIMAEAMEARCYTGLGRTRERVRTPAAEIAVRLAAAALSAAVLALDIIIVEVKIRPF